MVDKTFGFTLWRASLLLRVYNARTPILLTFTQGVTTREAAVRELLSPSDSEAVPVVLWIANVGDLGPFDTQTGHQSLLIENEGIGIILQA
jgi:hypothetical protein